MCGGWEWWGVNRFGNLWVLYNEVWSVLFFSLIVVSRKLTSLVEWFIVT